MSGDIIDMNVKCRRNVLENVIVNNCIYVRDESNIVSCLLLMKFNYFNLLGTPVCATNVHQYSVYKEIKYSSMWF